MRINHIGIYTKDLERLKLFYVTYFNAKVGLKHYNEITQFESYFLSFDGSDTRIELMTRPNLEEKRTTLMHIGFIHLCISVGSRAKVDYYTQLLESEGYEIISRPRTTKDGYYESCILDPDGNQIELTV